MTLMPGRSTLAPARELRPVAHAAWDAEYDRDVWRLRELGIDSRTPARIRFNLIPQPWLKAFPSGGHDGGSRRASAQRRRRRGRGRSPALLSSWRARSPQSPAWAS
ncbi:hypothetical protein AB0E63_22080 [Kribbella sp. NPDC026596]|uniref:hypothetical protein n=1 Tax=Kribbella sp. NPDC026596 TaxID=3155122 RepID=UPI0033E9376F